MHSLFEIKSFGGTAAEDDDIRAYFVRTPAFDELWEGHRHVVIGRKGSGKTALYLALLDRAATEGDRLATGLTFKQYPWAAHYRYQSTEVDTTERFVASWTFLILLEAFSLLLEDRPSTLDRQQSKSLGEVGDFIKKNFGSSKFDFKKAFPQGGLKLQGAHLAPSVMGNQIGGVDASRSSGHGLGETLQRINEWLAEKLRHLAPAVPKTYVMFDELDLGFDPRDDRYKDRVVGLLLAARSFLIDFTRAGVPIHPIVFLRSDIFERLHFGDKNKLVNSEIIELLWHDRLSYDGASLKHLIDWRIKEVLDVPDVQDAWTQAFDDERTRGTQHKFQHITYRTFPSA